MKNFHLQVPFKNCQCPCVFGQKWAQIKPTRQTWIWVAAFSAKHCITPAETCRKPFVSLSTFKIIPYTRTTRKHQWLGVTVVPLQGDQQFSSGRWWRWRGSTAAGHASVHPQSYCGQSLPLSSLPRTHLERSGQSIGIFWPHSIPCHLFPQHGCFLT